jgi:hypothetical protein
MFWVEIVGARRGRIDEHGGIVDAVTPPRRANLARGAGTLCRKSKSNREETRIQNLNQTCKRTGGTGVHKIFRGIGTRLG